MTRHLILQLLLVGAALAGCGGGGAVAGSADAASPPANVQAIVVDSGPVVDGVAVGAVNMPYVTVTVCVPGSTSQCRTIDHVELDTGSYGLRLVASAMPGLDLPAVTGADGAAVAECARFVDGYTWGAVRRADVRIAGEVASGIPIHVLGDAAFPQVPAGCSDSGGASESTVPTLRANGILGVGFLIRDCGRPCAAQPIPGTYYGCSASSCRSVALAEDLQVSNPVALFAEDNNGTIVQMPVLPAVGAVRASGQLIFGIGTRDNNGLGSAIVQTVDPETGNFTTTFEGRTYADSFLDTGSNLLFFDGDTLATCDADGYDTFYCPPQTQAFSAATTGTNGASRTVSFRVANAVGVLDANRTYWAFDDLAATTGTWSAIQGFDWGMPFFYGRRVHTAIEQRTAAGTAGPYVAY
jgi:hypothetical protein